jgi:hypothetical protein
MSEAGRRFAREHWDENVILPKMESELLELVRSNSDRNRESVSVPDFERRMQ